MLEGTVPVPVDTSGALRAARDLGFRMPHAFEWEYVAREGGSRSWICAPSATDREIRRALALARDATEFLPSTDIDGITNGFGIWGLYGGEWVLEDDDVWPTEPNASRGGRNYYPFQGEPALIAWAHPAVHLRARTFCSPCHLRFVVDLPSSRS
jgi:hypothetical protein